MSDFTVLPAPPGTRFHRIEAVASTGSTNADLLARAAEGAPAGLVMVADHQTAGRGRQRRSWHDQPGGALLVSLLLRPGPTEAPLVPLAAGLAAVAAVETVDRHPDGAGRDGIVGLKWPNDVLAPAHGERKLAGILAEAVTDDRGLTVVVGMGFNLRWLRPPPAEVAARAITLAELVGRTVERQTVLDAYLVSLDRWLGVLEGGGPLLDAYRARCLTLGRSVRFEAAGAQYRGRAADISPSGTLLLDTVDGRRVELHAGDAHHLG